MTLQRSGFKSRAISAPMPSARLAVPLARKPPRPRRCKASGCPESYTPTSNSFRCWCSPECGVRIALARLAKQQAVEKAEESARTRHQLEELKTLPRLHAEAQREFNRYIRLRDTGRPCICCDQPMGDTALTGGGIDAGHYRSVGSANHLRYREDNVHAQRKDCNRFGAGRAVDYRIGLIRRIGLAAVEALENDNSVHRWTRQEVREIRDRYRALANALAKQIQQRAPT